MKTKNLLKFSISAFLILFLGIKSQAEVTVSASTVWAVGGLEATAARDGNNETYWSSDHPGGETDRQEWIALDLGEKITLSKVSLTPRFAGVSICFPVDFKIQSSEDGINWTTLSGQDYTNYATPTTGNPIDFVFAEGISTQYIRVLATKLSELPGSGLYMWHLAEFDYSVKSVVAATVSASTVWAVGGLEATSARDGNNETYWSSDHAGGETGRQEWIALDLGEKIALSRVSLTPRFAGVSICFPVDFKIQSSEDGTNWTTITGHDYTNYATPTTGSPIDFVFAEAIGTQYIRVLATKLSELPASGLYMWHLAEFDYTVKSVVAVTVSTSSEWIPDFSGTNAIDGNPETYWASNHPGGETDRQEWIALDLGESKTLAKITLTPRVNAAYFPVDFNIQSSSDGINWTTISGQSYTNYVNPGNANPIDFNFPEAVTTKYIRILATKLSDFGSGFYMFHIAEFDYTVKSVVAVTVSTSSEWIPDFSGTNAIDGNPETYWASNHPGGQTDRQEWIALDLGESKTLAKITLTPRVNAAYFPVDFNIQSSSDGINWTTISGQSYTNYVNPGNANPIDFNFPEAVTTKYIRVLATKLSDFGSGFYMFHIAELECSAPMRTVPGSPVNVKAVAGDTKATISFLPPSNNGGSNITGYIATSTPQGIVVNGTESPIIVTGLSNGTRYTFAVTAINEIGESDPSEPSNAVFPFNSEPMKVFNGYDIYATTIIREGNVWKQWFGGWMTAADLPWDRMYYSVSEDNGQTWANPVEVFTIEKVQVNDPSVIRLWDPENSRYYYQMYYTYYPSGYGDNTNYIAVSTSLDGINWTHLGDQGNGVLIGADNGIDTAGAWAPSVMCLDSLGSEIYLYFHNNIPTGVYRTTLSNKGLTFDKESTIVVSGGFKVNVDVSIAPDSTWWMFYNSPGTFGFETSKMFSKDGINWSESFYNPTLAFSDKITVTPHIVWEDSINYQMWYGLGPSIVDFDVYKQNFQLEAEPFSPVVASSKALSVLGAENAIDGNISTIWSSSGYVDNMHNEWIYIDFDDLKEVYQVILTPRAIESKPACFPADFSIQFSLNGFDWTDISGHSYSNYNRADILPNIFTLSEPVTAKYIRVNATKLNPDTYGNYYFQLAEFEVVHVLSEVKLNNNPYLISIKVNGTELKDFSPIKFQYDIQVGEGSSVNVTASPTDLNAKVNIIHEENKVTIQVTAENNVNDTTYVLNIAYITAVDLLRNNKFEIFPNPATDRISIINAGNSDVFIYSSTGKLIYSGKCNDTNEVINIENFVPGLYLIKLSLNNDVKYSKLLIKR